MNDAAEAKPSKKEGTVAFMKAPTSPRAEADSPHRKRQENVAGK